MILESSIQEVMQRADIVEVVGQFLRLKKRGTNYIANCPFHNEKTPSFNVNPARGIFKCFGCGKGGNSVTFVQEHEKLTYPEAIRWLADYYKIELAETERSAEQVQHQQTEESLRILNDWAAAWFTQTLLETEEGQAIGGSYFKQRGFRREMIERFRLGYSPEDATTFLKAATAAGYGADLMLKAGLIRASQRDGSHYDAYRGRVVFPIQALTGRVLGFGARILKTNDKAPKYVNSPENELYIKSRVLYGLHQSRTAIGKADECFLVEGYTDVISLHQGGVENVVASSGTSLTEEQLQAIGRLTKNLTILYDGDAAGVKAALRGLDMALGQSFNVQLVLLPEGEDPDSFIQKSGASRFHEYVAAHRQDVIGFRLEVGLRDAGDDPVKRSKLVNEIAESISRINKAEDFALQGHYIKLASDKLAVDQAGFVALVNKYIRDRLDGEERARRTEARRAVDDAPPDLPPSDEIVETAARAAPPLSPDEEQEWGLLRMLVEWGSKPYEGYASVADLVEQRVDPDLIETSLVRELLDQYHAKTHDSGTPPEADYFLQHPDPAIQTRMALLLHEGVGVSPNWSAMFGIETFADEHAYPLHVDSTLAYFELKKLKLLQRDLMEKMRKEPDELRLERLMKRFVSLKASEAELLKRTGTVIVKTA